MITFNRLTPRANLHFHANSKNNFSSRRFSVRLEGRMHFIDVQLKNLGKNPKWIETFGMSHFLCAFDEVCKFDTKEINCQKTAYAITQYNLFTQSYFKEIAAIKELEKELQDNEEGTFLLGVYGSELIDYQQNESRFQGHCFTIIKIKEGNETAFRLAQSYIERYSLDEYVEANPGYYANFHILKKEILNPFYGLLHKKGAWTKKECGQYLAITQVSSEHLIGFFPNKELIPTGKLLERAFFGRTTNTEGHLMGLLKAKKLYALSSCNPVKE